MILPRCRQFVDGGVEQPQLIFRALHIDDFRLKQIVRFQRSVRHGVYYDIFELELIDSWTIIYRR